MVCVRFLIKFFDSISFLNDLYKRNMNFICNSKAFFILCDNTIYYLARKAEFNYQKVYLLRMGIFFFYRFTLSEFYLMNKKYTKYLNK